MPLPPPSAPTERALYLYENVGIQALSVTDRALYLYENKAIWALAVLERALYTYENRGIQALAVLERALYTYETLKDLQLFPWLMKIDPVQQYPGGQVSLYGDGFGDLEEVGASAALTASSGVPSNLVDRTSAAWTPTDGNGAWARFTFGSAQKLTQIALEGTGWGAARLRFSDGSADVVGGSPGTPQPTTEFPVGAARTLYTFSPRTVTWVEIRHGDGTASGSISEAWIWASQLQNADSSVVYLGLAGGSREAMGVVSWASRSPGLWPSNALTPVAAAVVVTVPADAVSNFVQVEETAGVIP